MLIFSDSLSRFCTPVAAAGAIFLASSGISSAERQWAVLSEADNAIIVEALSRKMLDPDSTRVSNLLAATHDDEPEFIYVCGDVQGRNGFGGYAQPTMFIGALVPNAEGIKKFAVITIAEQGGFSAVAKHCISVMPTK